MSTLSTRAVFAAVLLASIFSASTVSAAVSCPTISRTLKFGSRGADVTTLQTYLATEPSLYPEAGITGYFGKATEKAVQRFQAAQKIVSSGTPASTGYGSVGARTRAALASCPPPSVVTSPIATTTPVITPLPAASSTTPVAPSQTAPLSPLVTFADGATTTVTLGAGPTPAFTAFYFGPRIVDLTNDQAGMYWTSSNAASCVVEKLTGGTYSSVSDNTGVNGSVSLKVTDNPSTFSLRCTGTGDASSSTPSSIRREVSVSIAHPAPSCTVTTDKTSYVYSKDSIRVSWTSSGADSVQWSHEVTAPDPVTLPAGNQYPSGSLFLSSVSGANQTLTLKVAGYGGAATCSASFTIASASN